MTVPRGPSNFHASHPLSLVRILSQEICSLPYRIAERLRDQLDRRGVVIDPLAETRALALERLSAIDSCIQDMRNSRTLNHRGTVLDHELFAQAWRMGAAWSYGKRSNLQA